MPLNYSKWDQLELSDDSDIEGHPNVDKKSLIRWKQRDIHEKREVRKHKIAHLQAQIACNNVLLPKIKEIYATLVDPTSSTPPTAYFNSLIEKLETNPSRDCPPGNDSSKLEQTYDGMLLSLLRRVTEDARTKMKEAGVVGETDKQDRLSKELKGQMVFHVGQLGDTIAKDQKDLENEVHEQKKHITSDDLHEGFSSKYAPPIPEPPPVPHHKVDKSKSKVTEIEVLNPTAAASTSKPTAPATEPEEEEDSGLPEMTPSLVEFSKLPLGAYEKSFNFIQHHRDVFVPGAADALLVAAFEAQGDGKPKYAKKCIHQSLLLQYCERLGKDGVGVFFKKMISGDKKAEKVFIEDVENTHIHLSKRVELSKAEEAAGVGKEQIQLVPENPDVTISFNIPDGPPPEHLVLEGPGTEDLDIEEVRKALQYRWNVFQAFPKALQDALKDGNLADVNKVLGGMDVPRAETVVQCLDASGILNFADGGIRDETGGATKDE